MDKFMELEKRIESVLISLDAKIENKQSEIEEIKDEVAYQCDYRNTLKGMLHNVQEKKATLAELKNKSIIVFILKKKIKAVYQEPKQCIEEKRWLELLLYVASTIFILAMLAIFLTDPAFFVIITGAYILAFPIINIREILALRRLKKEHSRTGFNENILETDFTLTLNKINEYLAKLQNILTELETLKKERETYQKDLENVRAFKNQVITEKATSILNQAFTEFDSKDLIKRIRKREEQEEISNG